MNRNRLAAQRESERLRRLNEGLAERLAAASYVIARIAERNGLDDLRQRIEEWLNAHQPILARAKTDPGRLAVRGQAVFGVPGRAVHDQ